MLMLFLWVDSFNYNLRQIDENLKDCILRLQEVQEIVQMNEESLVKSDEIWGQEILPGFILGNWLFDSSSEFHDEKYLLMDILNKCTSDLEYQYGEFVKHLDSGELVHKKALVGLYKVLNTFKCPPIICCEELIKTYRMVLSNSSDINEFTNGLDQCFPGLCFSLQVPNSLKAFKPFREYITEVVRHLEALNDHGISQAKLLGQMTEDEIMQRLGAMGKIECSLQGNPKFEKEYLSFIFINDSGDEIKVICAPHTKLNHNGSRWRIYFRWYYPTVAQGKKLLVGHIGDHLGKD